MSAAPTDQADRLAAAIGRRILDQLDAGQADAEWVGHAIAWHDRLKTLRPQQAEHAQPENQPRRLSENMHKTLAARGWRYRVMDGPDDEPRYAEIVSNNHRIVGDGEGKTAADAICLAVADALQRQPHPNT